MTLITKNYTAYPTMQRFHHDYTKYRTRLVAGPPGSGKSVGCMQELLGIAFRQEPTPQGIRPTRFGVFRSTYGELEQTTLQTIKAWLPPYPMTRVNHSKPMVVRSTIPLPDGTTAEIEMQLLAVATYEDLSKLDSSEFTACWINEVTGVPKELIGKAGERCGRYPYSNMWADGKNHCTYRGVIGDYNYPDKDHWLVEYVHTGELPPNTMLYEQPPAMLEHIDADTGEISYELNPEAENLENLDGGQKYIDDLNTYKSLGLYDLIQTRLLCRYGRAGGKGKAIFTNFDEEFHVSDEPLQPKLLTETLVSIDTSGIHPCALIWQYVERKWRITDGVYGDEMGFEEFVDDVLTSILTTRYAGCNVTCVCDPANARDARTAVTPVDLLIERGYAAITAPTNVFKARLQACEMIMHRREQGALLISKHISYLIDALNGGYQYRKLRATGVNVMYASQPEKNVYSHWADAFQYGALHIITNMASGADLELARRIAANSLRRARL